MIRLDIVALAGSLLLGSLAPARAVSGATVLGDTTRVATSLLAEGDSRDALRSLNFGKVHGAPADHPGTTISLAEALRAHAGTTTAFDDSGRGDVEYWLRTAEDFTRSGRSIGWSLQHLSLRVGQGPVAAAISAIGTQLAQLRAGTRGDVYYWMNRTREISQRIRDAGQQLETIAGSLTGETVPLAAVVEGLGQIATSTDDSGRGDAEYWMRATRNFAFIGRAVGGSLETLASSAEEPLRTVLTSFARQLGNLSEAGRGDSRYWMSRAQSIAEQMEAIGSSLVEIARRM